MLCSLKVTKVHLAMLRVFLLSGMGYYVFK